MSNCDRVVVLTGREDTTFRHRVQHLLAAQGLVPDDLALKRGEEERTTEAKLAHLMTYLLRWRPRSVRWHDDNFKLAYRVISLLQQHAQDEAEATSVDGGDEDVALRWGYGTTRLGAIDSGDPRDETPEPQQEQLPRLQLTSLLSLAPSDKAYLRTVLFSVHEVRIPSHASRLSPEAENELLWWLHSDAGLSAADVSQAQSIVRGAAGASPPP